MEVQRDSREPKDSEGKAVKGQVDSCALHIVVRMADPEIRAVVGAGGMGEPVETPALMGRMGSQTSPSAPVRIKMEIDGDCDDGNAGVPERWRGDG